MKIGFIGCGNMGSAIIGGIIGAGIAVGSDITVADKNDEAQKRIADKHGARTADNSAVAKDSDIIFLCVKPNIIPAVLCEIKGFISSETIVVSIAAGVSLNQLEAELGADKKIVRVMPNTPVLVGEAMSAACPNKNAAEDIGSVVSILESFGRCETVSESLMDTVTAVSGSSPAYVFMMIEAMADGAVQGGMAREAAYKFAAQAVLGSAKMVLETGLHPGALKDMVCSPSGTTIDAVAKLEECGFRSGIIQAISVCREKSAKLASSGK